jgi:hypothetical protein
VIGTRPLSTLSRLLRAGSTTQYVTLGSDCPVLVVRGPSGVARWDVEFGADMTVARRRALSRGWDRAISAD